MVLLLLWFLCWLLGSCFVCYLLIFFCICYSCFLPLLWNTLWLSFQFSIASPVFSVALFVYVVALLIYVEMEECVCVCLVLIFCFCCRFFFFLAFVNVDWNHLHFHAAVLKVYLHFIHYTLHIYIHTHIHTYILMRSLLAAYTLQVRPISKLNKNFPPVICSQNKF